MSGETAALLTALLWSFTALFFSAAAERIGSIALNAVRLTFALVLNAATHAILYGGLRFPATPAQLSWLAASGLMGLVLGDVFYFRAMILIGPKRAALLTTLWPAIALIAAWVAFDERLGALALVGVAITLAGIFWSIAGRAGPAEPEPRGRLTAGILVGLLAATGQALGLVMARKGLEGIEHELSGSMARMAVACALAWLLALCASPRNLFRAFAHRGGMGFTAAGTVTGPFLGMWLSLYAATHGPLGIVATLMATTPLLLIPLAFMFRKERPTLQEILGALVAVGGVALLLNARAG